MTAQSIPKGGGIVTAGCGSLLDAIADRLTAYEQMAAKLRDAEPVQLLSTSPIDDDEATGMECVLCGAHEPNVPYWQFDAARVEHHADCPWLRAQRLGVAS